MAIMWCKCNQDMIQNLYTLHCRFFRQLCKSFLFEMKAHCWYNMRKKLQLPKDWKDFFIKVSIHFRVFSHTNIFLQICISIFSKNHYLKSVYVVNFVTKNNTKQCSHFVSSIRCDFGVSFILYEREIMNFDKFCCLLNTRLQSLLIKLCEKSLRKPISK